jgi:hypothetical protein
MLRRKLAVGLLAFGVLMGPSAAMAQNDPTAEAFLTRLYDGYRPGRPEPDTLGKQASAIFAPHLLRLIRMDQAAGQGDVGALETDPICACQDFENLTVTRISVKPHGDLTVARVAFMNIGEAANVDYLLSKNRGAWRIEDLREDGIDSLVDFLAKSLGNKAPKVARTKWSFDGPS